MITPSLNSLGFPNWQLKTLVDFARQNNVLFLELRGLENEMDLTRLPTFNTAEGIKNALTWLADDPPVQILSLNTGFRLLDFSPEQEDHLVRYAELAAVIGARYLRVFPGGKYGETANLPCMGEGAKKMLDLLAAYPVQMIVETHDCLVHSADILALNQGMGGRLNLLWDFANQINFSGERWQEAWAQIGPLVRYLHVKDTRRMPDGSLQNVLLLEGDLPVRQILDYLKGQPDTYIVSFEWEKAWDPSLVAGDTAALDYLEKLKVF